MTKDRDYAGIDWFRLIAAILVVMIHTSPVASFSETADFILTRIVARVAVPFFLMTSGFFLISRYSCGAEKLVAFLKKTALIYGTAILIYIPVNIYNGYFRMDNLLPNMIKDIVFDGTLYHLWYLPAAMAGAVAAWFLVKKSGFGKALAVACLLYLIGLFGDSYYGLAEKSSFLRGFYDLLFQVSDYTRNGIFYAPIFFVLGGLLADKRQNKSICMSIWGFGISFALMFGEAMILHHFDLQKHDSMYLFLPLCMYFLFQFLLRFRGRRKAHLRTVSLIVYIIHPMVIVAVRLFAKLFHLQPLLVENSIVHFLAVCAGSVVFAVAASSIMDKLCLRKGKDGGNVERACLEINLNHLEHNVGVLKAVMQPNCELMAVVKADAYGHGMFDIATHVNKMGVRAFAVATIDEGIALRKYGISGEILILGYTIPARAGELRKYDLTQTLIDYDYAVLLNQQGCNVKGHIKVDTGMHRLGFDGEDVEDIAAVCGMEHIMVEGIYTHLCAADSSAEEDICFTNAQIEAFYHVVNELSQRGITIPKTHIQSSYGLLNYPEVKCDYVRVGILLYGVSSSPDDETGLQLDLKPVLSLKSKVILLRTVQKGDSVGYSRSFVAQRDSLIGIVPIGYADGYPRSLSGEKCYVLIHGQKAPVVGKICMDQLAVDVTDIPEIKVGDKVTLIGCDGTEEISAAMVADEAESITNELLSRMGKRVQFLTV